MEKRKLEDIKSDQVLRAKAGQESEEVGRREGWRSGLPRRGAWVRMGVGRGEGRLGVGRAGGQGSLEVVAGSGWEQGGERERGLLSC